MAGKKGRSGQKQKLPSDIELIVKEINLFGIKRRFLKKYKVSDVALQKFLQRRGYRLVHKKIYSLEKIAPNIE